MQTDWLFTGILPDYDGLFLFIILGVPALVLIFLARQMEEKAMQSVSDSTSITNKFTTSYRAHPGAWSLVHRLSVSLAMFLVSQWFLFVFGFTAALIVFVTLVAYGANRSLSEIIREVANRNHAD